MSDLEKAGVFISDLEKKRLDERQERIEETFYSMLMMLDVGDDQNLQLDPYYLRDLGPEKTVVLFLLLRDEYYEAYSDSLAPDGSFMESLREVAECTGLSVGRTTRIMEQLSDLPPSDRSKRRYRFIRVLERGPEEWRIAVNDDVLDPD